METLALKLAIEISDLDINDMLLLEDGHCFREGVLNLCKTLKEQHGAQRAQILVVTKCPNNLSNARKHGRSCISMQNKQRDQK